MTKKKQPAKLENIPPIITRNAKERKDARDKGLTTGFMQNHKRGAPLKIAPATNNKIKMKVKATLAANPTKQARPVTRDKYHNWNLDPFKSALACAVEVNLKGIDPQTAEGDIVITAATLHSRVKSSKAVAEKMGKLALLYLDNFKREMGTEKKNTLTSETYRDYIQQFIALRDLKKNAMSRNEVIYLIQKMSGADFVKAKNH